MGHHGYYSDFAIEDIKVIAYFLSLHLCSAEEDLYLCSYLRYLS